jgi:6-phosphogluconolactonase (cycloisomerase 2 family)
MNPLSSLHRSRLSLLLVIVTAACGSGDGGAGDGGQQPPTLMSVAVRPTNSALKLGDSQAFVATGTLTDHTTVDLTRLATWSSSDASVLRLDNSPDRVGVGHTRGPGTATVTATKGGIAGSTTVTVTRWTPKFLYASNLGATTVSVFSVDPATGGLTPVGAPVPTTAGATSIAVTRDFRFLYSTDFFNDKLSRFSIQPDGSLASAGTPLDIANAPLGVVAHPTKDVLYVSTQGSGITVVNVDSTSGAASIAGSVELGNAPQFGALSPDGALFYQTLSASDQVVGFSVGATGALTSIDGGVTTTAHLPRAVAIDPAGKFLYVVIAKPTGLPDDTSVVEGYSIDSTSGALTKITGSPFDAGVDPVFAMVDPSGRFLFVANYIPQEISEWVIDPDTGALAPVAGSPFGVPGASPFCVTVEPSARYLYVGAGSVDADAGIRGFTIDQSSGVLSPNPSATAPGTNVWSIAVTH